MPDVRDTLVLANAILAVEGLIGPFGHASVRLGPAQFAIAKHTAGSRIEAADLRDVDVDLAPDDVKREGLFSEVFIHSAVYKEHPGVGAVVHTHSPYAIALGTLELAEGRVVPTTNPGSNLGHFIPIVSEVGLVQTPQQGQHIARAFQGQNGVLLRGHGAVVIGETIEQAVLRAIYLELEARTQLISRPAGRPSFYKTEESDLFRATRSTDHAWGYYVDKVRRHRPEAG